MRKNLGISGSTLKIIAIISMFIDHTGAVVVMRILNALSYWGDSSAPEGIMNLFSYDTWLRIYDIMRAVGRIAFPIFCFLLVEGFFHTHSRKKYALRLLLFCLISEIPFDLAFEGSILEFHSQNVFFTLFLGLLTMMGMDFVAKRNYLSQIMRGLWSVFILFAGMFMAYLLSTDYSYIGVFCIVILYMTHSCKKCQLIAGCLSFLWELPAPLAFLPIAFYNGTRGWNIKYLFYIFYPAHLLLLVLLCYALGI